MSGVPDPESSAGSSGPEGTSGRQQRILALTCEVLARSVYLCAARSPHVESPYQ